MEQRKVRTPRSILVDENSKSIGKKAEESLSVNNEIPNGYCTVKLDSLGKLDAPQILHFRNYLMEELLELASSKNEYFLNSLVKCLNKMVYEKFDCSNLHEKELEEIMLTLYVTYWSSFIEGKAYYIDDTLDNDKGLNDDKNIGYANVPIKNIKTTPISNEFKEPIKITIGDTSVKFRLSRIKDILIAREYVDSKFFKEERELSDIKAAILDKKKTITYEMNKKYSDFEDNKSKEFYKVLQCNLIVGINEDIYDNLDSKIENYQKIDSAFWKKYNNIVNTKCDFGVDSNVDFFSTDLGKEITRRFSFRSLDFVPTLELSKDTDAIVSFGD